MSIKRRGLGRGLDVLLTPTHIKLNQEATDEQQDQPVSSTSVNAVQYLPIEALQPGQFQPRQEAHKVAIDELSQSIKSQGLIQPIVVRALGGNRYEIIAGERRWHACQQLQMATVPCLVRDIDDHAAMTMALIENIQREDLNIIEQANALQNMHDSMQLSHQALADLVGKSRSTVSNLLRLNGLNQEVKKLLEEGHLEMGHGRAILMLEQTQQGEIARQVVAKNMSVRETELLIKHMHRGQPTRQVTTRNQNIIDTQDKLAKHLNAKVTVQQNKQGQGRIVISYSDLEHLEGIVARIR
ncbi:MAG: ParB/RepB/Spo0J family partition protein [Shewanellaceae bacterium]|nr:ParB/RepB/Spo0J family partition protein [Shewanellaceae bacterium]